MVDYDPELFEVDEYGNLIPLIEIKPLTESDLEEQNNEE